MYEFFCLFHPNIQSQSSTINKATLMVTYLSKYFYDHKLFHNIFCHNFNVTDCAWLIIIYLYSTIISSSITVYHITVIAKGCEKICGVRLFLFKLHCLLFWIFGSLFNCLNPLLTNSCTFCS